MIAPALPTSGLTRFDRSDRITIISLPPDMPLELPDDRIIVAIDCGSLWWKVAVLRKVGGIMQITIYRIFNFLVEKGRAEILNDEDISHKGKTYSIDEKGAYLGGQSKLRGNKMDGLRIRLMAVLNFIGLGNGEKIDLSITTFYEKGEFKKRQAEAKKQLSASLSWSSSAGPREVEIANSKIYPEGYHLGFYRSVSNPKAPIMTGWQAVYDIGNRTFGAAFISPSGKFDDERSLVFDGEGVSLYREWVAQEAGIENPECPTFIQCLDKGLDQYQPQGESEVYSLVKAKTTALKWYIEQLSDRILECTPAEIEISCIGGGGAHPAHPFGQLLLPHTRGNDRYVVSEPDIANVATQAVMTAREIR
jgi:hypothetical protein